MHSLKKCKYGTVNVYACSTKKSRHSSDHKFEFRYATFFIFFITSLIYKTVYTQMSLLQSNRKNVTFAKQQQKKKNHHIGQKCTTYFNNNIFYSVHEIVLVNTRLQKIGCICVALDIVRICLIQVPLSSSACGCLANHRSPG